MSPRRACLLVLVLGVMPLGGCASLPDRQPGVCGNAVVEEGEDCDTFLPDEGASCAPAGSEHACRWLCSPWGTGPGATAASEANLPQGDPSPAGARCPGGFGCGRDGVCRAASPRFEAHGEPTTVLHEQLLPGDFNGDGLGDVLTLTDYDSSGFRLASVSFSTPGGGHLSLGFPSLHEAHIEDLDRDGRSDLVFIDADGVSTLLGEPGNTFAPVTYPIAEVPGGIQVRMFMTDANPKRPGDESFGLIFLGPDASLANFDGVNLTSEINFIAALGALSPGDVLFPPSLGQFTAEPCPTVVFTIVPRRELLVWPTCKVDGLQCKINPDPPRALPLPAGVSPASAQSGDVDGDGNDDLILADEGKLWVSPGDGQGFEQIEPWLSVPLPAAAGTGRPLLVRDLNKDGKIDVLMKDRLVISTPEGYQLAFERLGGSWDSAVVADFNANGRLDVAASARATPDIDFLFQSAGGLFTNAKARAAGGVSLLSPGDFDGDEVLDLAYVAHVHGEAEPLEESNEARDTIEVIFGKAHGTPEPPALVSRLPEVIELVPGRIGRNKDLDNAAELTVQFRLSSSTAIATIRGSSSRSLRASRQFLDGDLAATSLAITTDFSDDTVDIISLAREASGGLRLWGTEAIVVGAGPSFLSAPLPPELLADHQEFDDETGAVIASGELLPGEGRRILVAASLGKGSGKYGIVVARRDADRFELGQAAIFDGQLSKDSHLRVLPLEGGEPRVVLSTGSVEAPGELVLFRAGQGLSLVREASPAVPGGVAAWTCHRRNDGTCELLAINESGVYRPKVSGGDQAERVGDLPGGIALASEDLDGDGLSDLVIGDGARVQFFRAIPVRP